MRGFLDIHGGARLRRVSDVNLAPVRLAERTSAFIVAVHGWE